MEGNGHDAWTGWMTKKAMRTGAVVEKKTCPLKRPYNVGGRAGGQARHMD